MALLNPEDHQPTTGVALWHLGFRPLFLAAAAWAVIAMIIWMGIYHWGWRLPLAGLAPNLWHAHEMLFGYALAVIAGFLLTAVRNWTQVQTLNGWRLALLGLIWIAARLLFLFGSDKALAWAVAINGLFILLLALALAQPVFRTRQWGQAPIVVIPLLLLTTQISIGAWLPVRAGIYLGLMLVLLLIFILSRRVLPFFIEKGIESSAKLKNYLWLDIGSLVTFLIYGIAESIAPYSPWTAWLAGLTALLHGVRLALWHRWEIWTKPLLWILWLAYLFIIFALVLRFCTAFISINPFLAIHAFTAGGVALMTMGMMSRVALGHTGRDVFAPPKALGWLFAALTAAAICRVALPLLLPHLYSQLILLSQILWIASFSGFLLVYAPMLIRPRIDGRYG